MPIPAGRAMLPPSQPIYIAKIESDFDIAKAQLQTGFSFAPFKDPYSTSGQLLTKELNTAVLPGQSVAIHNVILPRAETQKINRSIMTSTTAGLQTGSEFFIDPNHIQSTQAFTRPSDSSLSQEDSFPPFDNEQETSASGSKGKQAMPNLSSPGNAPWKDQAGADNFMYNLMKNSANKREFIARAEDMIFGSRATTADNLPNTANLDRDLEAALKASRAETFKNIAGEGSGKGKEIADTDRAYDSDMDDDAAMQAAIAMSFQSPHLDKGQGSSSGSRS